VSGPFRLQAAIAACHATAPTFAATDWRQIAAHYATLFAATGSPAARIHEAQAAAQFDDPARVLTALDAAVDAQKLAGYVPLHAVRGDLLERCGQRAAAAAAFRLAAEHSGNDAEQRLLLARAHRTEAVPGSCKRNPRTRAWECSWCLWSPGDRTAQQSPARLPIVRRFVVPHRRASRALEARKPPSCTWRKAACVGGLGPLLSTTC
jgi:hypothetical protein